MNRRFPTLLEPLAVVAGVRTPFAKAFGTLASVPADELGRIAVTAAIDRAGLRPDQVDEVIFGNVACPADTANISRVIAIRSGIPHDRAAHTVHRNCASGMEAIVAAWQAIREGRAEVVIAGGTESMSNVPLLWDSRMKDLLIQMNQQKSLIGKMRAMTRFRPSMLRPIPGLQLGLVDPTCGLNMGQTAELLVDDFGISREEQDRFALRSHQRAVAAWGRCFYGGETVPVVTATGNKIERDTGPRPQQTLESLARLKPLFDVSDERTSRVADSRSFSGEGAAAPAKAHATGATVEPKAGSVTAGNSCPITDGACALVLMSVEKARALGRAPLGYIRDYAVTGCEPRRMGLGPVHATNRLISRHGLSLSDFDLFEINEAFAGQVIACQRAFASEPFAEEHFSRTKALGEIPDEKLNVNGGAIALGHPVGTTGARLVLTLLRALKEKQQNRGLASLCVGGGQGMAMWLETEIGDV